MPQPGKEASEVYIQDSPGDDPEFRLPTRTSAVVFFAKSRLLQLKRGMLNVRQSIHRHPPIDSERLPVLLTESVTPLRTNLGEAEVYSGYRTRRPHHLRKHARRQAHTAAEVRDFHSRFETSVDQYAARKGRIDSMQRVEAANRSGTCR